MLLTDEAPTEVLPKYFDYANIFSPDLAIKLPEYIDMNDYIIELEKSKQPLYSLIYNLGLVELEIIKTYINTYLKTGLISPSKSPEGAPIFFDWKKDRRLRFYVNYRGLNILIIKNRYPLPLINETLDWLGQAKRFS